MTGDIEPSDDEIIEHLKSQGSQRREHAAFFTWHDRSAQGKGIAEAGIVDDLLSAMQAEGRTEYRSLGASGEQWPDVWLESPGGQQVPCEVTELIDTGALPAGVSRSDVVTELVDSVQSILDRKGLRSVGGASGTQSVLVIHTDEFYLNADNVADALKEAVFKKPSTIQRAFFLLSYDPTRGGYRYFDLRLAA
jgi:hypothetical protein